MAFQKYTEHVQLAAQEGAPGQIPHYPRRLSTHLCHIISGCMSTQIDDPTSSRHIKVGFQRYCLRCSLDLLPIMIGGFGIAYVDLT